MKGGKISDIYSDILFELKKVDGVKMLAVAERNGFLISEPASYEKEMLTRMSANILKAAGTLTNKFKKVGPRCVIVNYDGGKIITMNAGQKALISVMTAQEANLDTIITELERTAGKIKKIL